MHCNATSVFFRFNYDAMQSLKSLNLSITVSYRYCRWYITFGCDLDHWPRDLDHWPLTLNICSVSLVTWWNIVPNLNAIELFAAESRSYCDFIIWPYDLEHALTVALGSGIIFTKFDLR